MEPLACTVHAAMKARIQLCDSVCVIGDGPIALLLAQLSLAAGATHVYVLGILKRNLELAEQLGCIPLQRGPDAVQEVLRRTQGRGVDVTFEAVGVPVTFNQAMAVTRTVTYTHLKCTCFILSMIGLGPRIRWPEHVSC